MKRSWLRAGVMVVAAGLAAAGVWSLWESRRSDEISGVIPAEGRMYQPRRGGVSLVVPAPLYPLSRVASFRVVPAPQGEGGVLHLLMVTSDPPAKVADWYADKWSEYGVHRDEAGEVDIQYRFVVNVRGQTAVAEIWGAGWAGDRLVESLQSLVPVGKHPKETKVLVSVPWAGDEGG